MLSDPELRAALRREVGWLRRTESRARFQATVHAGAPAAERRALALPDEVPTPWDRQLRVDLLALLLEGRSQPDDRDRHAYVWLTRPGPVEPTDEDFAWLAAAESATGIIGRPLDGCFAVTRSGWLDVRTGEQRVWRRLRLA